MACIATLNRVEQYDGCTKLHKNIILLRNTTKWIHNVSATAKLPLLVPPTCSRMCLQEPELTFKQLNT